MTQGDLRGPELPHPAEATENELELDERLRRIKDSMPADLTDNTGGTADDTLEAIPDPADAPVDADALRDDLVANALPAIRNDLADLAARLNTILAALRGETG